MLSARREIASAVTLTLLLTGMLTLAFNIQPVKAGETIYIRADGSIDPPTAPISTADNITYTLTGNITSDAGGIVIERDSIVLNGAGCIIQGAGSGAGITLSGRTNLTIQNTTIKAFYDGIDFGSSSNNSISGNNITANNAGGVWLSSSRNNTLSGNNITNNGYGIRLDSSSNSTISENNITNNGWDGVVLDNSSSNNTLSGNNMTNNGWGGVWLVSSSNNNTLFGNNITNNGYGGVWLYAFSSNNTLSGNNITANEQGGVLLISFCSNNTLSGNNITANNGQGGVCLSSSRNNTLSGNNITNNWCGVWLDSQSRNNRIYHNNFMNNTSQVYSSGSNNVWDDGYPYGGNYWSDYAGVDRKVGANQDVPGTDGLGDFPYVINAYSQDNYPLMKPWSSAKLAIYISVPWHAQISPYYCGPAALEMVFNFYGLDIDQLEIADVARTSSDGTYTCDMVRAAHFSNRSTSVGREMEGSVTGYSARKLGYAAFEYSGMTLNELKSLITAGYPVIVLTTWHFRVAVGYDSTHITFQDSWYGEMLNITVENFDADWDYSGHWALLVVPWKIKLPNLAGISAGDVFNVTASISYPCFQPFDSSQYPALLANATITLPTGLTLVSDESTKIVGDGSLTAGTSANVTWSVRADSPGNYTVSVEAEGIVPGFVPPIPNYPESYNYDDRIGGDNMMVVTSQGHDVAVTRVAPGKSVIGKGFSVNVTVTLANQGTYSETFNVTLYANETIIGTREDIILSSWDSRPIMFMWNTSGFAKGSYSIGAVADVVQGEVDMVNNNITGGWVIVAMVGDITGPSGYPDGKIDVRDVAGISSRYGAKPPNPKYDVNWDITGPTPGLADGRIDVRDVALISSRYGQKDP